MAKKLSVKQIKKINAGFPERLHFTNEDSQAVILMKWGLRRMTPEQRDALCDEFLMKLRRLAKQGVWAIASPT